MRTTHLLAAGLAFLIPFGANAEVYNFSATKDPQDFDLGGGIEANGVTLLNNTGGALTYIVTPFDGETTLSTDDYRAARRFGAVSLPTQGWEWSYWVQKGADTPYQVGFGGALGDAVLGVPPPLNGFNGGVPATPGDYADTPLAAFNQAPATHSFVLAAGQAAKLYWRDDIWTDNTGGISVNVTVVPEPEAYGLALAGVGVVAVAMRRRRGPLQASDR